MAGSLFSEAVRTGDWLSRERIRRIAAIVLAVSVVAVVAVAAFSDGWTDWQGRPLGTDFSCFYTAGLLVLQGRAAEVFDPAVLGPLQLATFGPATPFYGWLYPPFFLLVTAALALVPYPVALASWLLVTLALYLWSIRAIVTAGSPMSGEKPAPDRLWLLLALAFPAVLVDIGHGQNGFLTAALLGGALVRLDRRPLLAGVLLGLLVYKPQFGPLIPLVLIATGRWRAFAAAAATVVVLVGLTVAAFGPAIWQIYLASAETMRVLVLEQGAAGWHKLHGVFAWTRMWGGSVALAYSVLAVVALTTTVLVVAIWRRPARYSVQAAALIVGALLVSPHCHDYDLMLLAPALAFLITDGFRIGFAPFEKTVLAVVWLVPLVGRSVAETTHVPLGTLAVLALFWVVLRRSGVVAVRGDDVRLGPSAEHILKIR